MDGTVAMVVLDISNIMAISTNMVSKATRSKHLTINMQHTTNSTIMRTTAKISHKPTADRQVATTDLAADLEEGQELSRLEDSSAIFRGAQQLVLRGVVWHPRLVAKRMR